MSYDTIKFQKDGYVGIIMFDRPERMNAVIEEMYLEIQDVLGLAREDESIRALILTGSILKKGDVLRHIQPGAGGYGNPLERDPHAVYEDVLDEKLSIEYVKREYGVVIDPDNMSLDLHATRGLRDELAKTAKR